MALGGRRPPSGRGWLPGAVLWTTYALLVAALAAVVGRLRFDPVSDVVSGAVQASVVLLVIATAFSVWAAWRSSWWPPMVVVTASLACGVPALVGLVKSPLGLQGADRDFRMSLFARFGETPLNVDASYPDLPGFVPPLWFWIGGRAAAVTGHEGWQAMGWMQIATAFAVPVLAYLFWRRVVPDGTAAVAAAVVSVAVPDLMKGDQWVALAVCIPWWLNAFPEVSAPGRRPWPSWLHGVVAGLLLSTYTAWFVPLAAATVVVLVVRLRQRRLGPLLRRWIVLVLVGLLVWAWMWVPLMLQRSTGLSYDRAQLEWFPGSVPFRPLVEASPLGLLVLVGIALAAGLARRDPLLRWTGVLALAGVVVIAGGLLSALLGQPMLVQKLYTFVPAVLCSAAVLGLAQLVSRHGEQVDWLRPAAVAVAAAWFTTSTVSYQSQLVESGDLARSYDTTTPDGRRSAYSQEESPPRHVASDVLAADIEQHVPAGRRPLVLSSYEDLFNYEAYWNLLVFSPQYSNPYGEREERWQLVQQMADTQSPEELARLMRSSRFGTVDALVLAKPDPDRYVFGYKDVAFLQDSVDASLEFDPRAWQDDELFDVVEYDTDLVVSLRQGPR